MRKLIFLIALLATASLSGQTAQTYDANRDPNAAESVRAATAGLSTLAALARRSPEVIGLTAKEAASAEVLPPLRVVFVKLDGLKNFTSADDPRSLLVDVGVTFYPIAVSGGVRSSITVKRSDGGWKATQFGSPLLAKRIEQVRGGATSAALLVRVPGLNLDFIGVESGGVLKLTSLFTIAGTDIRQGDTADARTVFAALAPLARKVNGLPT
jgi:hypothetical protein